MSRIVYPNNEKLQEFIFSNLEKNRNLVEQRWNLHLGIEENGILIQGDENKVQLASLLFDQLKAKLDSDKNISEQDFTYHMNLLEENRNLNVKELLDFVVALTEKGKPIKPKTLGQKKYIDTMRYHDVVFGIGPAGTGKTYLAMAMAISAFKKKEVNRIVLTRPAVEAGESLGFLPGDLQEKVDPYLRPIYDALFEILGFDNYIRLREKGIIEVAPLAYMRGRTLDDAFIILDEAQNTTNEQMKMFLTRIGFGSKAVITGDVTQQDLPRGQKSGLIIAEKVLAQTEGIAFMYLQKADIVRHPLVQSIISAYEVFEKKQ